MIAVGGLLRTSRVQKRLCAVAHSSVSTLTHVCVSVRHGGFVCICLFRPHTRSGSTPCLCTCKVTSKMRNAPVDTRTSLVIDTSASFCDHFSPAPAYPQRARPSFAEVAGRAGSSEIPEPC